MSFGFSVGDIIAVGKLVEDIISCLKDPTRSQTEYQDLVRELECLRSALVNLDRLMRHEGSEILDSIKYAALSCRRPLEEFLIRIRKYDRSLCIQSRLNPIRQAVDKVKFPLRHGDEIQRLQTYLNVHIGTINMLLTEHGFEKIALAAKQSQAGQLHIKQQLETAATLLDRIRGNISHQRLVVSRGMSMLEKVYRIMSGELQASIKSIGSMVEQVCISTQQIYTVVVDIQASLVKAPDTRWTFFQDPVLLEDALGRKLPVPSEYDFPLLDAIIKCKFKEGPGAAHVAANNYEIMDAMNKFHILSNKSLLKPGSTLIMAIILDMTIDTPQSTINTDKRCPNPKCQSDNTMDASGGGSLCCSCNMWFDLIKNPYEDNILQHVNYSKKRKRLLSNDRCMDSFMKRRRLPNDYEDIMSFKNVKVTNHETWQSEKVTREKAPFKQTLQIARASCQ
ncbi:hypothetical protein F5Y08DRAFT_344104 [Xylaria arbuscula]|nr:hypothetical protein F5Y08DRAFT_344104 [Xylaria arbuscula]